MLQCPVCMWLLCQMSASVLKKSTELLAVSTGVANVPGEQML